MRIQRSGGGARRLAWVGAVMVAAVGIVAAAVALFSSRRGAEAHDSTATAPPPAANSRPVAASTQPTRPTPTFRPAEALRPLPTTEDPVAYAAAVAARLFDVSPADLSRSDFLRFWLASLPTVVYSDGAAKGLTLSVQNADAINNLTHGWIPSQATWTSEAAEATVGRLQITSVSVPSYWIDAVSSGEFTDPGLHMERVTGVLTESYGVGHRYRTTRPIVIDLGLLCGPTQPGGCRLLAPQQPPGQTGSP